MFDNTRKPWQILGARRPGLDLFQGVQSRFVRRSAQQIIADALFQFIGIGFLVGFLLFLLNILVGVSLGVQQLSNSIQDKLGVYLYIKEAPGKQDEIYSQVIRMKDSLEGLGMEVRYVSKDDAIKLVGRKVPSVIQSFEKYGIKNPLPATVYVLFDSANQYEILRKVLSSYADIIANREDISAGGQDLQEQEKRILHMLGFSSFIVILSYVLIALLVVVVLFVLVLIMRTKFDGFRTLVRIQQLLGANYTLIRAPFVLTSLVVVLLGFVICAILLVVTGIIIGNYTISLFDTGLLCLLGVQIGHFIGIIVLEFILICLLITVLGHFFLQKKLMNQSS